MKFCKTAIRIISAAMAAIMCFTQLSLSVCALSIETKGSIILGCPADKTECTNPFEMGLC